MPAPVTNLGNLLSQYQNLETKSDTEKLKEVEGQIAQALARQDLKTLPTQLPPEQLAVVQSLAGRDSFQKSFYSWGGDIGLLLAASQPVSATRAQEKRTDAVASQLATQADAAASARTKDSPAAANAVQTAADNMLADGPGVVDELEAFIGTIRGNSKMKRELAGELEKMKAALMGLGIEAEGFQTPRLQQALAFLSGEKSTLSSAQKAALTKASEEWKASGKTDKLFAQAKEAVAVPTSEAFKRLPPEEQEKIKKTLLGQQKALDTLHKAGSTKNLSDADKAAIASAISAKDEEQPFGVGGLTLERIAKMPKELQPLANDLYHSQEKYVAKADFAYNEIMGLLNSSLPIEMIVMLVMAKLSERSEEKLRLKMKEAAFAEQVEKLEKQAEQQGKKLDLGGLQVKSNMLMMQEIQVAMQQWTQFIQALSGVLRMIQDMTMTPIRNIR